MALQRIERHVIVGTRRQRMDDDALRDAHRIPEGQERLDRRFARRRELAFAHRRKAIEGAVDVDDDNRRRRPAGPILFP